MANLHVKCEACQRAIPIGKALQTPLGYYICEDQDECIAEFSGWNDPPSDPVPSGTNK